MDTQGRYCWWCAFPERSSGFLKRFRFFGVLACLDIARDEDHRSVRNSLIVLPATPTAPRAPRPRLGGALSQKRLPFQSGPTSSLETWISLSPWFDSHRGHFRLLDFFFCLLRKRIPGTFSPWAEKTKSHVCIVVSTRI